MSKKSNELKNAIQSLKVSEALRLSKRSGAKDFSFKSPQLSEIETSSDQKNLGSNNTPLDSNPDHCDPSAIRSQIEGSRDRIHLRSKQAEIDSRSDTNDLCDFDVAPFAPNADNLELVERGEGSFHIPHKIYEFVHKAVDTKVELLVFNCLLRYTLRFQRTTCPASQSFISRWTGIAVPNVRKALRSLIERGFIRRLEEGTISHDSAVYELPIVTAYLAFDRSRKFSMALKKSEIETRSDKNDLGSNQAAISDQIDPTSEIDLISKKEKENKNRNNSLSPMISESLEKYFSNLAPKQKRERELKAFEDLKAQFEITEISRALDFVQKHGALKDRTPVHSPMAYLSLTIHDVLRAAREEDAVLNRRHEAEQKRAIEAEIQRRREEHENEETTRKERAFCGAFSTVESQEEFIQKICTRSEFTWKPKGQIARNLAIQTWWDELSPQERKSSLE